MENGSRHPDLGPEPIVDPDLFLSKQAQTPPPKKVSREDMLRVENIYLKIEHGKMQEQVMKQEFTEGMRRLMVDRKKYQEEILALSTEYSEKYGIKLGEAQILPDGTIVPAGSAPANSINPALSTSGN